jgi:glycosyltransferase involved in cell wall biosynthesis
MVSVVIPAFNEEKNLPHCLDALVNQKTNISFEVVLVDNNSTDKTAIVARTYQGKLPIRVIYEPQKGRGVARKTGFAYAKGNIILSTDADTVVPPNWVETLVAYLKDHPEAVAVTGPCIITDCSPRINKTFNLLQPKFMRLYRAAFGHYWLSGFNFAIRRDVYDKAGGFPENNTQEDIELSFRVRKYGKIAFLPSLPVVFSGRRFEKGLIQGIKPYVTTFADSYVLHRKNVELTDVR